MSRSVATDTRLLSVSILSGPSAPALFQRINATETKRRLGLLTSATADRKALGFVVEQLAHDPAQITDQVKTFAEKGTVDHLIVECDPERPAIAFASLFLPHGNAAHALTEVARLTTTVMAITPPALLDVLVHRRDSEGPVSPCFIVEQLEFASNIILEGADRDPDFALARAIASTLNPRAQMSDLSQASLARLLDDRGTSLDFAAALDGTGWRQLIDAKEPGRREENITAFAYRARKPFHPERLRALLQGGFPRVFRAKGFFWLATRMDLVGGLNMAGSESHFASAGEWWAARDERTRQAEMPERTRNEWTEPFGDRRQAIAFMGLDFNPDTLRAQLDACLLTDPEMAAGEESWNTLPDPFPSWSVQPHHHECTHDHDESDQHDCCHH